MFLVLQRHIGTLTPAVVHDLLDLFNKFLPSVSTLYVPPRASPEENNIKALDTLFEALVEAHRSDTSLVQPRQLFSTLVSSIIFSLCFLAYPYHGTLVTS